MYKYSATPWTSTLTELEVFIGNIMGKDHRQSKRQRESSITMREGEKPLTASTTPSIFIYISPKNSMAERLRRIRSIGRIYHLSDPRQGERGRGITRAICRLFRRGRRGVQPRAVLVLHRKPQEGEQSQVAQLSLDCCHCLSARGRKIAKTPGHMTAERGIGWAKSHNLIASKLAFI